MSTRRIISIIEIDDNKAIDEDLGSIEFLEKKLTGTEGINLTASRILDDDDKDDRYAIIYADKVFNDEIPVIVKAVDKENSEEPSYIKVTIPLEEENEFFEKFKMGQAYAIADFDSSDDYVDGSEFDEHLEELSHIASGFYRFIRYMELCGYKAEIINEDYEFKW